MHYIFEQTQVIWRDRCAHFKDFEESLEITESLKHLHFNASGYNLSTSQKAFSALPFINNMIRLGTHQTNFWCSRGQVLFHFWLLEYDNMVLVVLDSGKVQGRSWFR
jgi:hypothetical protein